MWMKDDFPSNSELDDGFLQSFLDNVFAISLTRVNETRVQKSFAGDALGKTFKTHSSRILGAATFLVRSGIQKRK